MFVLCQYFSHRDASRAAEYEYCLRDHIRNGHQLILFEEHPAPEDIRQGAARCIPYPQRITYDFVFKWANANLPAGSVAALVNLDIMVRFSAAAADAYFQRNPQHLMCLSRLEYKPHLGLAVPDPVHESLFYMNCQDAWVFRTPVPEFPRADFPVGNCPGCDNAIAFRAAEAGMIPVNVAGSFPIWHYDTRPKESVELMNYDAHTHFVRPEKGGRLFLPRIQEGTKIDAGSFLGAARDTALRTVQDEGYGRTSDAQWSNYVACLTGMRCVNRWDLQYLFLCIAYNNPITLINP